MLPVHTAIRTDTLVSIKKTVEGSEASSVLLRDEWNTANGRLRIDSVVCLRRPGVACCNNGTADSHLVPFPKLIKGPHRRYTHTRRFLLFRNVSLPWPFACHPFSNIGAPISRLCLYPDCFLRVSAAGSSIRPSRFPFLFDCCVRDTSSPACAIRLN